MVDELASTEEIITHWGETGISIVVNDAIENQLDPDEAREVIIWQAERIAELEVENAELKAYLESIGHTPEQWAWEGDL